MFSILRLRRIFIIGVVCLIATQVSALEARCRPGLEELGAKVNRQTLEKQSDVLSEALAKYVRKNKVIPDLKDFAAYLETSQAAIRRHFKAEHGTESLSELLRVSFNAHESDYEAIRKEYAKNLAVFYKRHMRAPTGDEISAISSLGAMERATLFDESKGHFWIIEQFYPKDIEILRSSVSRAFARAAKATGRTPEPQEVAEALEISNQDFESLIYEGGLFETWDELKHHSLRNNQSSFQNVIDTDYYNIERAMTISEVLRSRKRFILTTAVASYKVNEDFLNALLNYAERMDAEILVYPANLKTNGLDPILLNHPKIHILTHSYEASDSFMINRIPILGKQINPLTGLDRIGKRGQSVVVGSPKMHQSTVPTLDNSNRPHQLMSTGSISYPSYAGKKYIQGRTDEIAKHDHEFGAIIVEANLDLLESDPSEKGRYHWRHIEYIPEKKGFMDLNRFYTADSVEDLRPEALVMGDIHVGDLDPAVLDSLLEEVSRKNPKRIVIHDIFNGHSVSHHDAQKIVHLAWKAKEGKLDLAHELKSVAEFLSRLARALPEMEIVIVHSNHDFWLHRWLNDGRFTKEPHNSALGFELGHAYHRFLENPDENPDPLLYGIMKFADEALSNAHLSFLNRGQNYGVGPEGRRVELGLHGHVGANGGKGSLQTFQKGVGRIVFGHTHTEGRRGGAVNVGTSTLLSLPYNLEGLSNWVQSYALVGPNGEIQVLRFQGGFWHLSDNFDAAAMADYEFFPPNYPVMIENNKSTASDFDQYGGE